MIHNITISPIFSTITIIDAKARFTGPPKWRALERALASTPCLLVSLLLPLRGHLTLYGLDTADNKKNR